MKKRILLLSAILCVAFAGCGNNADSKTAGTETETTATTEASSETGETESADSTPIVDKTIADEGIDAFVTLGEYKDLKLTRTITPVTEEDVENAVKSNLANSLKEVSDATVEDGDTVNIDYVGKVDGKEFDGGSQEGADLIIGSGSFIPGFEDQLVGWKTGDSKDITVTFPEDYQSEDLKGKEAVFTVKLNAIKRAQSELTEEWVKENSDFKAIDEYKSDLREQLEVTNESTADQALQNDAFTAVYEASTFHQYPKALVEDYTKLMKDSYQYQAESYGMEYEEMLSAMGLTEEGMEDQAKEYVRVDLLTSSLCEKEGITSDSEVYKKTLDELLKKNNLADKAAAIEAGITEEDMDRSVKSACFVETILKYADVTEKTAETEAQTEAPTEASESETSAE